MHKLSKPQIKAMERFVEKGINLYLICDEDSLTLEQYVYKRKLRVTIYVNGHMKGCWIVEPKEHRESKYFMPKVSYRKVGRKKKRERVEMKSRQWDYASAGQALRYFNKVCDVVKLDEEKMGDNRMSILNRMVIDV